MWSNNSNVKFYTYNKKVARHDRLNKKVESSPGQYSQSRQVFVCPANLVKFANLAQTLSPALELCVARNEAAHCGSDEKKIRRIQGKISLVWKKYAFVYFFVN